MTSPSGDRFQGAEALEFRIVIERDERFRVGPALGPQDADDGAMAREDDLLRLHRNGQFVQQYVRRSVQSGGRGRGGGLTNPIG